MEQPVHQTIKKSKFFGGEVLIKHAVFHAVVNKL